MKIIPPIAQCSDNIAYLFHTYAILLDLMVYLKGLVSFLRNLSMIFINISFTNAI